MIPPNTIAPPEGRAAVEARLAKAIRGDSADAPSSLDLVQTRLWHRAQAEAYRHALEMMAPAGHEPPAAAAATPAADTTLSFDQLRTVARIHNGHRVIVAGGPGTGRTMAAIAAARLWQAGPKAKSEGPSLLLVREFGGPLVDTVDHVATHDGVSDATLARYGLIVIDDAGDGSTAGTPDVVDRVLRRAPNARIARFVDAGPNDADATIVLTERFRQA